MAYRAPNGKGACDFHWARGRLFDHAVAVMLYEPCVAEPLATVLRVRLHPLPTLDATPSAHPSPSSTRPQ